MILAYRPGLYIASFLERHQGIFSLVKRAPIEKKCKFLLYSISRAPVAGGEVHTYWAKAFAWGATWCIFLFFFYYSKQQISSVKQTRNYLQIFVCSFKYTFHYSAHFVFAYPVKCVKWCSVPFNDLQCTCTCRPHIEYVQSVFLFFFFLQLSWHFPDTLHTYFQQKITTNMLSRL